MLNCLSVKVSKGKTLLLTWVGLFFEATIPQLGWSGEVSKTYLLTKNSNVDAGKIGASVVGQKVFTMTITVVALSTGLGLVLTNYHLPLRVTMLIGSVLCLSILALAIVYYVSVKPAATRTLLIWATKIALFLRKRWNPLNFQLKAEAELNKFHVGIKQLTANPKTLVKPAVCAVFGFICEVSVVSISFIALGFSVPIDKVLIVFTLTGTLQTARRYIFWVSRIDYDRFV